jgi:hypothetical protein
MTIQRDPGSRAIRQIRQLRDCPGNERRFGRPSDYGLTRRELATHVRQLRRSGWQDWELGVRFGQWAA